MKKDDLYNDSNIQNFENKKVDSVTQHRFEIIMKMCVVNFWIPSFYMKLQQSVGADYY